MQDNILADDLASMLTFVQSDLVFVSLIFVYAYNSNKNLSNNTNILGYIYMYVYVCLGFLLFY